MEVENVSEQLRNAIETRTVGLRDSLLEARIIEKINHHLEPINIDDPKFDQLIGRLKDKHLVLLGESTHGTDEFYRLRAQISERLIREHGFEVIAFEADFPDMDEVNDYINGRRTEWSAFHRFPTWMWRNSAFSEFTSRIRNYNVNESPVKNVSFFGLDLYSLHTSLEVLNKFFQQHYPEKAKAVLEAKQCLEPWKHDPTLYGLSVWNEQIVGCREEVLKLLEEVVDLKRASLSAQMNAYALKGAEQYYRAMFQGSAESWNVRDQHMFETICYLLKTYGPKSKMIVWEHNSHIGNCAATQMAMLGEHNVGQLCKKQFGDKCSLVGFFTSSGTVAAADNWGGEVKQKQLRSVRPDSFEYLMHKASEKNFVLNLLEDFQLNEYLKAPRLERAVGVLYLPNSERQSHYFAASLSEQFDEVVWLDETKAVEPLDTWIDSDEPETYPFGI